MARDRSVARQLLAWQVVVVVVLVVGGLVLAWLDAHVGATADARRRALDLAVSVADAPTVRDAVTTVDPSSTLQPFAEQVRRDTETDFVVIMSPDGIRFSHPDPALIGQMFRGTISQAQAGERFTETYTGTLGPSVRAVVPVFDGDRVVALVSVGIRTDRVDDQVLDALPRIIGAALGVGALGLIGVALVSRRLTRQTHGLGEAEITRMYEYYDAVLHGVREGLVLIDADGRISLLNDEARRLLGLDDSVLGAPLAALELPEDLTRAALEGGSRIVDDVVALPEHTVVVSVGPARWGGRRVGAVLTLRDHTDLQALTTELDTVRSLADSLRAQTHESANRVHTMVSLIGLGRADEAVEFATRDLALAQQLADQVVAAVGDPVVAALLLGKSAQAAERGVDLVIDADSRVPALPLGPHEAVTVIGNLIDNAIDAAQAPGGGQVRVWLDADTGHLDLQVDDSGPGIAPADRDRVFTRGWSTKDRGDGHGLGLALVGQVVRRHGGRTVIGESSLGGARVQIEIGDDR